MLWRTGGGVAWLIKTLGLDWLLDLFASYNTRLQFQSLALPPHTAVHSSLGHFFCCLWSFWNWCLEVTNGVSVSLCLELSNSSISLERICSSTFRI
jgi:hypothetical protein